MRRCVFVLLVALFSAGCVDGANGARDGPGEAASAVRNPIASSHFGAPVVVAEISASSAEPGEPAPLRLRVFEPTVAVARDGRIWVTAPACDGESSCVRDPSKVWTSRDGETFTEVTPPGSGYGNGDSAIHLTPNGTAHLLDLGDARYIPYARSEDGGLTWHTQVLGGDGLVDRPWIAGFEETELVVTYVKPESKSAGLSYERRVEVLRSRDGGATWTGPFDSGARVGVAPSPAVMPDRDTIAFAYIRHDAPSDPNLLLGCGPRTLSVELAISRDGGTSWESRPLGATWTEIGEQVRAGCFDGYIFPSLALDSEGNYHVAWARGTPMGPRVFVASSVDGGHSWSVDEAAAPPDVPSIMPWIVAGRPGEVAVSYYYGTRQGDPNLVPDVWSVGVSLTRDAGAARPAWTRLDAVGAPVRVGTVCTSGTLCAVADRSLGDFFTLFLAEDGRLHLATAADGHDPVPSTRLLYLAQGPVAAATDA
jgi:hypothetical protein